MLHRRLHPLLACLLACGPVGPDVSTSDAQTTAASSSGPGASTTADPTTAAPTTGVPMTTDFATTDFTTTDTTTQQATTDTDTTQQATIDTTTDIGPCVVDPARGICTQACDLESDCCKCNGQHLAPDPAAMDCQISAGIVTAVCPWVIDAVRLDGVSLAQDSCDGPGGGWQLSKQDGDIVIKLCSDACTTYLAGRFTDLELGIFCEAA